MLQLAVSKTLCFTPVLLLWFVCVKCAERKAAWRYWSGVTEWGGGVVGWVSVLQSGYFPWLTVCVCVWECACISLVVQSHSVRSFKASYNTEKQASTTGQARTDQPKCLDEAYCTKWHRALLFTWLKQLISQQSLHLFTVQYGILAYVLNNEIEKSF